MTLKISIGVLAIDDEPASMSQILANFKANNWWKSDPIRLVEGELELTPNLHQISPNQDESCHQFIQRAVCASVGPEEGAAAGHDGYFPATVFLIDWRFDQFSWDYSSGPKPDGISLIKKIKNRIPHAFCALVTAHDSMDMNQDEVAEVDFSIEKPDLETSEGQKRLIRAIVGHMKKLAISPSWEGLQEYASLDKEIFHAQGVSDGQNASSATQGFIDRFGQNLFASEASLTLAPFDSLLSPADEGCIRKSQEEFAGLFGARRARFGTNGTSGANSILWSYLFDRGEIVLVDQNCHISHHYAAARQGVTPLYLRPEVVVEPDVFASPTIDEITEKIRACSKNLPDNAPKGIVLTNCSFDGYIIDSIEYIQKIRTTLVECFGKRSADEFVFVFDEAWFSFARFDPGLIRYTAMYAVNHLNSLENSPTHRVYATQSIHKTLTALRQASVILEADEYQGDAETKSCGLDHPRFQQAFLAGTTTSPSAPIVASFDIARRQMALEGSRLIHGSAQAKDRFLKALRGNEHPVVSQGLSEFPSDQRRVLHKGKGPLRDPTKVTLFHKLAAVGGAAKKQLWGTSRIQINKFGLDSFMFMFMPGYKNSRSINVLKKLARLFQKESVSSSEKVFPVASHSTLELVVDTEGTARSYPFEVVKHGGWAMGEVLFGRLARGAAELTKHELIDDVSYMLCSFVTPYPPGFPIIYPGQVLSGRDIKTLFDIEGEVHGVSKNNTILVRAVPKE